MEFGGLNNKIMSFNVIEKKGTTAGNGIQSFLDHISVKKKKT